MRHTLRGRPEGRLQCTRCRAAYSTAESAALSAVPCYGGPLPHGHRYEREHVLYPLSYDRGTGMGPDRLCDDGGCICVGHDCDCDVCRDVLDAPGLKVLMDSHDERNTMTAYTIEIRLPAPIRKHVERVFVAGDGQGDHDLIEACKGMGAGKSNQTLPVALSHGALGSLLQISRELAHSDNGGESLGARSILKNYEDRYEPLDPREIRHSVRFPASLLADIRTHAPLNSAEDRVREELHAVDQNRKGRLSNSTLGWVLERFEYVAEAWSGQPVSRAAKKFRETWVPVWQETEDKVNTYESTEATEELVDAERQEPGAEPLKFSDEQFRALDGARRGQLAEDASGRFLLDGEVVSSVRIKDLWARDLITTTGYLGGFELSPTGTQALDVWTRDRKAGLVSPSAVDLILSSPQRRSEYPTLKIMAPAGAASQAEKEWKRDRMSHRVSWSDRPRYFWFGGTDKKGPDTAGPLVYMLWSESSKGRNRLRDVDTGEMVAEVSSMSSVWTADVHQKTEPEPDQAEEDQEQEEEAAPSGRSLKLAQAAWRTVARRWAEVRNLCNEKEGREFAHWYIEQGHASPSDAPMAEVWNEWRRGAAVGREIEEPAPLPVQRSAGVRAVPQNLLDMCEEADTETARAWWRGYCERYRRGLV